MHTPHPPWLHPCLGGGTSIENMSGALRYSDKRGVKAQEEVLGALNELVRAQNQVSGR